MGEFVQKHKEPITNLNSILEIAKRAGIDHGDYGLVTWRGVMTKLLTTPFSPRDAWEITGCYRSGTIYLMEKKRAEAMNNKVARCIYGGYKFEALCMVSPSEGKISMAKRQSQIVNTNQEYNVLFKSVLGSHRLLLGAEIDGLDEDGTTYIELKTTAAIRNEGQRLRLFRDKMIKWWTQSFLAGVPAILIGYRDEKMHIERLEKIRTEEIPRIVRGKVHWDPNAILAFGEMLLSWLSEQIRCDEGSGDRPFALRYDPLIGPFITLELQAVDFLPSSRCVKE